MSRRPSPMTALALAAALLAGCGYGLVGRTSNLPDDIQSIYIEPLTNRTTRSQVDLLLTQAIADEFVKRRRFEVLSERSRADAVLTGAVTGFSARPVTIGAGGRATQLEILLVADMVFKRPDAEEPIWAQSRYQFRELYDIDVSAADYFDREDEAIEEVAEKFAETLLIDLLEGF